MREDPRRPLVTLLHIPSFYGACTWGIWFSLYLIRLIQLNPVHDISLAIFLAVELCFIAATIVAYPSYRKLCRERILIIDGNRSATGKRMLFVFHFIGFAGILKYIADLARYFGGIGFLYITFLTDAPSIRGDIEIPSSIGIQLSYFGWIAIALTVFAYSRGKLSGKWLVIAALQYAGNFLYIGRTQPIWILFTTMLMILPMRPDLQIRRILTWGFAAIMFMAVIFWAGAEVTGKTYQEGRMDEAKIKGLSQVVYAYGVSGFAYFNHMLQVNERPSYNTDRLLYPFEKFKARLGFAEEPPTQIIEFYSVPFETNVGTFLEPLFRDGGILFIVLGILTYSFGLNLLGIFLLNSGTPLALYGWSNLCFTAFIAFFVPKISSFPVWFFVGAGILSASITAYSETTENFLHGKSYDIKG